MKQGIYPDYVAVTVACTCGNTFEIRSTVTSDEVHVDVCLACRPLYIGKQKILDTGDRVARFRVRYGKRSKQPCLMMPAVGSQGRRRYRLRTARVPPVPVSTTPSQ